MGLFLRTSREYNRRVVMQGHTGYIVAQSRNLDGLRVDLVITSVFEGSHFVRTECFIHRVAELSMPAGFSLL